MEPRPTVSKGHEIFDISSGSQRERIEIQSSFIDSGTIRHLEALGVREGWRCAEIGAGTGSIAVWLARRAGPAGRVVATDVDTRFLDGLAQQGLEVRCHDSVSGPLEEGTFDLVHARLLLRLLPERERVLHHMVASLRPGGWLLIEDFDLATAGLFHPPSALQARVNDALERLLEQSGVEPRYGIKLLGALRAAGLEQVEAEGRLSVVPLGSPGAEVLALKLETFRVRLAQTGLVTEDEVNRAIAEARDPGPGTVHYPPLMVAAWGRKPSEAPA